MAICTGSIYTQRILRTECVGNSLVTINNNFQNLDLEACRLSNEVIATQNIIGGASPLLCGLRLSLDPNTPTPTSNRIGSNATTLYMHPFKGNVFSLYNTSTNKWDLYHLTAPLNVSIALLPADTNFDVYLYNAGTLAAPMLTLEIISWTNNAVGGTPPTRGFQNNVIVKFGDASKRFIGCFRTTDTIGQSEQSFAVYANGGGHTKQFVWNAQTTISVTSSEFDAQEYTIITPGAVPPLGAGDTGFKRVNAASTNNGKNNRFSFIVGEVTTVEAIGQVYAYSELVTPTVFSVFGVNEEDDPYAATVGNYSQLLGEAKGSTNTGASRAIARAHLKHNFNPGYHYIQLFERIVTGSAGNVITMNRNIVTGGASGIDINTGKTGIIASLSN